MGGWFAEFLSSQGFQVTIADPRGAPPGFDQLDDWQDHALDSELIVLATPLSATAEILKQLAARAPRGLIFDLGSLKTPLRAGLDALVRAGCRVTSLHPDVRTGHAAAVGPARDIHRLGPRAARFRKRRICSHRPWRSAWS